MAETSDVEWREYNPVADRDEAHRILRDLLERGPVPYTIHPGEWDWWTFHADPRFATLWLIGDSAVAEVGLDLSTVVAFGARADEVIALGERYFGSGGFRIGYVSARDVKRVNELQSCGFTSDGEPEPSFERTTGAGVLGATLPSGFVIRNIRGEAEHAARASAARRAFSNSMDPGEHARRYLRFMRSPGYEAACDIVAVDPGGKIGAFAIHWPDTRLSLAQFEPVGTDPEFQRRGLSRAVVAFSLERLSDQGVARARVMTSGTNFAAAAFYSACGFQLVDRLSWWKRETSPARG